MTPWLIASVFFVFLSLAAAADTLTGKVVKITDGDTLYVLDANYKEHKIRLAGIDAIQSEVRNSRTCWNVGECQGQYPFRAPCPS